MPGKYLPIEQILAILRETPARFAALTTGMTPVQLRTPPGPGEWSANEVLAHLRACNDMWGGAIREILIRDRPTIKAINPRRWIEQTDYRQQGFQPSLRIFIAQRAKLVSVLESISQKDWSRTATVTGAGKPLQLTVLSYADRMARHERPHVSQIERLAETLLKG